MLELLHNRNFVLFWFASMFFELGGMALQFVISLYAYDLTGSAALFGFLLFIVIVPRLLIYPLAGVWADRYDRRLMMLLSAAIATIVLIVFTALHFLSDGLGVVHLFFLMLGLEAGSIVFMSTNMAVPPMIVTTEQLGAANSLGILYSEFGYVAGQMIGALLYGLIGFGVSLLYVLAAFLASLIFMAFIHLPRLAVSFATRIARSGVLHEFVEGLRLVVKDGFLLRLLLLSPLINMLVVPVWDLILLFFARGELGLSPIAYGIFSSLQSLANIIMAPIVAKLYHDRWALQFVRISPLLIMAFMLLIALSMLLAQTAPLAVVLALAFAGSSLVGVTTGIYVIGKNTFIQKQVAMGMQSRIFSLNRLMALLALPLGNLVFGFVVEGFGTLAAILVGGAGIALVYLVTRQLRLPDAQSAILSSDGRYIE
ncbi:MAG: MFS transporter [Coriobacteriales bacterium]|jgi:MFS family permease|nr:MFS transporter [Coriobacteriales bacterium]